MKKFVFIFLTLIPTLSYSQKVHSVNYSNQSDLKVYVVKYENQCDLKVFKVKYSNQVNGNQGLWFFTDYQNQTDLKIFFVKYKNQAGWRNKSKKQLMY